MGADAEERERRLTLLPAVLAGLPASPVLAALQPLLTIGPWAGGETVRVIAGGEERWLIHAGSLIKDRHGERAIDAFELRATAGGPALQRLVRKSVWDSPTMPKQGLADEALFLAGPGRDLAGARFRLPRLHACAAAEWGVTMVMEQAPATAAPQDWHAAERQAAALGEFAALSHGRNLQASPLVKPMGTGFKLETMGNLQRLAELCLADGGTVEGLLDGFFAVFGEPDVLRRIRDDLCPCICHEDAFARNMLIEDGGGVTVIIDWGKVRGGFIGHDAGMLLLPGFMTLRRLRRVTDFGEAADRVFRFLWQGVAEAGGGVAQERVRLGLDFALLQGIARFGDRYFDTLTRTTQSAGEPELRIRRKRMASALDFGLRTATDLARRFG